MRRITQTIIVTSILLSSSCAVIMKGDTVPARIPAHSPESLAELRQAAKSLLYDKEVIIAASAFTKNNRLILSRKPIRDPQGRIIQTRVDEQPVILELYLAQKDCYLTRIDTNTRVRLTRSECLEI